MRDGRVDVGQDGVVTAALTDAPVTTTWRPGRPVDVRATLGPLVRGGGDPTHRYSSDGTFWRTCRTPDGPATLALRARSAEVTGTAWGPGADWVVARVPDLLGARDDVAGFVVEHPLLRQVHAAHPGLRIPRTGLVFDALVPTVLEQKVTGIEARRSWRELLWRYGEPAPGPAPKGMRVPPDARTWARIPTWGWHRAGVDSKRSAAIVRAAHAAGRLEETTAMAPAEAGRRLQALPGIGVWTAAEVAQRALGDADAVSVGDLHIPRLVGWALLNRPLDDAGMLELLAPYAPHRHRVVRLVELSGVASPRFNPRYAARNIRGI
jgi:3-methyladenine DNA glycosylase/8-oxoguanine DNA glycosylase